MEGQVFVPYTGIGGFNMNTGASTFAIGGSSMPGVVEDEHGTTVNVTWTFPGGINNVGYTKGAWGYALVPQTAGGTYVDDDMITDWLLGKYKDNPNVAVQPNGTYNLEDIRSENPLVMGSLRDDINQLVKAYVSRLLRGGNGSIYDLQTYFPNCYTVGSPG